MADNKVWEYRRIHSFFDTTEVAFKEVGLYGWELVSVVHEKKGVYGYFKREKD